jgi:ABC-type proline/glycine betaine transport system substrate-binding protein
MKWIVPAFAAAALAVLSLSIPSPVFTTEASASKMNGKGIGCSTGHNCMQDRYYAAKRKAARTKKPQ